MSRKQSKWDSYHSALGEEVDIDPIERCVFQNGEAFRWDITNGMPPEFDKCGAVYSEPPWRSGFESFNKRAGVDNELRSYQNLIDSISSACVKFKKPCFILTSKADSKLYKKTSGSVPVKFEVHGFYESVCVCFNVEAPNFGVESITTAQLIKWITKKYSVVGDFCCGYGTTGEKVIKEGGYAVLCDYNPKCVAVVAQRMS